MAKLYDMAQMTVSGTPGTSSFVLAAAAAADGITYKTFAQAGAVNSDVVSYRVRDGAAWEIGRGTVGGGGTTLTRGPLLSSAAANAAISASSAAVVLIAPLAEDFLPVPVTVPLGGTGAVNFPLSVNPTIAGGAMLFGHGTGPVTASQWWGLWSGVANDDGGLAAYGPGNIYIETGGSGGTAAVPAATPNNTYLAGWWADGYDGAAWRYGGSWYIQAAEVWSATAKGTKFTIDLTPTGSTATGAKLTLDGSGKLTIAGGLAVGNNAIPAVSLSGGNYTSLRTPDSTGDSVSCILLGPVADPTNYHRNTTHYFQDRNAVGSYGYIDASGLTLNNATSNLIYFANNGLGPPTFTTRSVGTKLVLWPNVSPSTADYAIGMDGGTMWFSTPGGSSFFRWYVGTTQVMALDSSGNIQAAAYSTTVSGAAAYFFEDRTLGAGNNWGMYAQAGLYRLWRGADKMTLDVGGNLVLNGSITPGAAAGAGDAAIELGNGRTANGAAYIDMHTSVSSDFDARIIKLSGVNGNFTIENAGSGAFYLNSHHSGGVSIYPNIGSGSGNAVLTIGAARTVDGSSFIDLLATAGAGLSTRLVRYQGTAGAFAIEQSGGGIVNINTKLGVGGIVATSGVNAGIEINSRNTGTLWTLYDVDNAIRIYNTVYGDRFILTNSGTVSFYSQGNTGIYIYTTAGGYARLFTSINSTRMWSLGTFPDGNFNISDETALLNRLTIDTGGTATFGGIVYGWIFQPNNGFGTRAGTPGPFTSHVFNVDWTGVAYLWIDNVNVGQIAFVSDYRTKKDIEPLPSTWDRVKALRPISYTRRDNAALLSVADPTPRWGFIAHELQETLIEGAASGRKDAPNQLQSPDTLAVLAATTKALQEAMARIEALEARP